MLAFITSLRHPQNAADYGRTEQLLKETLASVAQQTSDDFVVIVVGNQRPAFELGPKVHFVPVDFPPPPRENGPHTGRAPFVWDKGTKIGIGLIAAREFRPDHVMIFDADDFVHRGLVEFVSAQPESPGWVVDKGWMYSRARRAYKKQDQFNRYCGTCFVIPFAAYEVPAELTVTATQDEVAAGFGERLETIMGAHKGAVQWHRDHGRELAPLPFRAAIYHVDTGENHSGKTMRGLARPLGARLTRDFAVPATGSRIGVLWGALGPRPAWQSLRERAKRVRAALRRPRAPQRA
jgi:hypothetical protein